MSDATIIYTYTDEAPALATHSLLPIVRAYAATAGVDVQTRDISLAGRILAVFADRLPDDQRTADALAELGELAKRPEANIIKLPNISASIPQLKAAVAELQAKGYDLPDYPDEVGTAAAAADSCPVRQGQGQCGESRSARGELRPRAPASVKNYARAHPHSMGAWSPDSTTDVACMSADDFRANEKSVVIDADTTLRIELVETGGGTTVLRESVPVLAGEVVDATVLRVAALRRLPGGADRPGQG